MHMNIKMLSRFQKRWNLFQSILYHHYTWPKQSPSQITTLSKPTHKILLQTKLIHSCDMFISRKYLPKQRNTVNYFQSNKPVLISSPMFSLACTQNYLQMQHRSGAHHYNYAYIGRCRQWQPISLYRIPDPGGSDDWWSLTRPDDSPAEHHQKQG